MQREVLLSEEFLCVVTVKRTSPPGSLAFPHYITCLEFTGREPNTKCAFLFEVITSECNRWRAHARCRIWSLVSAKKALDDLNQLGLAKNVHPMMSSQEQLAAYLHFAPDVVQAANTLADPLWHRVPSELQETGVLAVIDEATMDYLDELGGYPLSQLTAAIQTAAQEGNWNQTDPHTLLPPTSETTIAVDEQVALAQSLILRLVADLPDSP